MAAIWLIVALIVAATSLWAYADVRRRAAVGAFREGDLAPAGVLVGCLLFWIVFFPWYLVQRARAPRPAIEADELGFVCPSCGAMWVRSYEGAFCADCGGLLRTVGAE